MPIFIEYFPLKRPSNFLIFFDHCYCLWNKFLHVPEKEEFVEKHNKRFGPIRGFNVFFNDRIDSLKIGDQREECIDGILKEFLFISSIHLKTGIGFMVKYFVRLHETAS